MLDGAIQRLEFKVTALPPEEAKVHAELRRAGVDPARRKVYFYDTPELALFARDLALRARVTAGDEDDSTVKLRPLPLPDIPARWSATDGVRIELDATQLARRSSVSVTGPLSQASPSIVPVARTSSVIALAVIVPVTVPVQGSEPFRCAAMSNAKRLPLRRISVTPA